jgi:L-asparagine permease
MSASGVPYGGILMTAAVALLGVGLNAVLPDSAFEIVLNVSSLCLMVAWATIVLCQLRLFTWSRQGKADRPSFRMFGAPWTGYLTLAFLLGVVVLIGMDYPVGTYTIGSTALLVPLLALGWYRVRKNVRAVAAQDAPEDPLRQAV